MNSKSILLFLVGFGVAYVIFRNRNTATQLNTANTSNGNANQSGGHLIIHPIDVDTTPIKFPAPDASIILPKP